MAPKSLFQIEIVEVVFLPVREIEKRKHLKVTGENFQSLLIPPRCSSYHSKLVFFHWVIYPTMFLFSLELQILKPIKQPYICFFFGIHLAGKNSLLVWRCHCFFKPPKSALTNPFPLAGFGNLVAYKKKVIPTFHGG